MAICSFPLYARRAASLPQLPPPAGQTTLCRLTFLACSQPTSALPPSTAIYGSSLPPGCSWSSLAWLCRLVSSLPFPAPTQHSPCPLTRGWQLGPAHAVPFPQCLLNENLCFRFQNKGHLFRKPLVTAGRAPLLWTLKVLAQTSAPPLPSWTLGTQHFCCSPPGSGHLCSCRRREGLLPGQAALGTKGGGIWEDNADIHTEAKSW